MLKNVNINHFISGTADCSNSTITDLTKYITLT